MRLAIWPLSGTEPGVDFVLIENLVLLMKA